jgi:hypothetical protein
MTAPRSSDRGEKWNVIKARSRPEPSVEAVLDKFLADLELSHLLAEPRFAPNALGMSNRVEMNALIDERLRPGDLCSKRAAVGTKLAETKGAGQPFRRVVIPVV